MARTRKHVRGKQQAKQYRVSLPREAFFAEAGAYYVAATVCSDARKRERKRGTDAVFLLIVLHHRVGEHMASTWSAHGRHKRGTYAVFLLIDTISATGCSMNSCSLLVSSDATCKQMTGVRAKIPKKMCESDTRMHTPLAMQPLTAHHANELGAARAAR